MRAHPLLVIAISFLCFPVPAQALEYRFRLYAAAAYVVPVGSEAADTLGWEFGVELKPTDLLGIELAYLQAEHDVEQLGTTVGEISFEPIHLSANLHVVRTKLLTFWVGPTVSWANVGNLEVSGGGEVETGSELAYGASTGLNVSLVQIVALHAGVRWLKLDVESTATGESLDVDPFFVSVGLALRF